MQAADKVAKLHAAVNAHQWYMKVSKVGPHWSHGSQQIMIVSTTGATSVTEWGRCRSSDAGAATDGRNAQHSYACIVYASSVLKE